MNTVSSEVLPTQKLEINEFALPSLPLHTRLLIDFEFYFHFLDFSENLFWACKAKRLLSYRARGGQSLDVTFDIFMVGAKEIVVTKEYGVARKMVKCGSDLRQCTASPCLFGEEWGLREHKTRNYHTYDGLYHRKQATVRLNWRDPRQAKDWLDPVGLLDQSPACLGSRPVIALCRDVRLNLQ